MFKRSKKFLALCRKAELSKALPVTLVSLEVKVCNESVQKYKEHKTQFLTSSLSFATYLISLNPFTAGATTEETLRATCEVQCFQNTNYYIEVTADTNYSK